MAISCGIVGLPNVGKSTLFNALTLSECAAENFPFCTIEPNQGRVLVPDERLELLKNLVKPQKVVPAVINFWDIAGLVKGAAQGEGLGNQFLHHIREVDAILQVVRCFKNDKVVHVDGRVDPIADIEIIETELILSDISSLERWIERAKSSKIAKTSEGKDRLALWSSLIDFLSSGQLARNFSFSSDQQALMHGYHLLTAKPILYIANASVNESEELNKLKAYAESKKLSMISLCIAQESELISLPEDERLEMIESFGIVPMLPALIRASMDLLNLQSFFTVGVTEVRAWAIPKVCTAQNAARAIHSDIAKGFIRAEVIRYTDFVCAGGEQQARANGKLRLEGRDYFVEDGDIMHFRFNV